MAGTFSNIFSPASGEQADNSVDQPFEPVDGSSPPDETPKDDGDGPPPEIASGMDSSFDDAAG
ncbi:MAG TPA: hypothetical protein VMS43_01130 [Allosphingosinicella sp.]|nr:hypothetical protein [Allosphingosinicella sp.]